MPKTMEFPHKEIFVIAVVGGIIIYWLTSRGQQILNDVSDDLGI